MNIHALTITQANELEMLQKRALKVIFGWNFSYENLQEKSSLDTLESKRSQIMIKFTTKTASNDRFNAWFPEHEEYQYELRKKKKIPGRICEDRTTPE